MARREPHSLIKANHNTSTALSFLIIMNIDDICEKDKNILFGVLIGLQHMHGHDDAVMYGELVSEQGAEMLIAVAKDEDALEWSGLINYGYCDSLGRYTPHRIKIRV